MFDKWKHKVCLTFKVPYLQNKKSSSGGRVCRCRVNTTFLDTNKVDHNFGRAQRAATNEYNGQFHHCFTCRWQNWDGAVSLLSHGRPPAAITSASFTLAVQYVSTWNECVLSCSIGDFIHKHKNFALTVYAFQIIRLSKYTMWQAARQIISHDSPEHRKHVFTKLVVSRITVTKGITKRLRLSFLDNRKSRRLF
jgi:hypothetical protein